MKKILDDNLVDRIKNLMRKNFWDQKMLAEKMGITTGTISQWLNKKSKCIHMANYYAFVKLEKTENKTESISQGKLKLIFRPQGETS